MPTCPKCGSPRVGRYCAKCGAESVIEPDERGYLPRGDYVERGIPAKPIKRSRGLMMVVAFTCIPILIGIATFAIYFTAHSVTPLSRSRFPSDPQMDQLMRDFDLDAGSRITDAEHSLNKLATTGNIELRLSQAKNDFSNASATRVRLGSALRQARLEDRWPVKVGGVNFRTPQQLVDAMGSCDAYMHKASAAEIELERALDQNKKLQSDADGIVDEMKRLRADGDGLQTPDRTALRVDQQQIQSLSEALQQKLHNWTDVDWNKAHLDSFYLRAPQ
jgi:hypothetical protein